jgi:hypothetical protein
MLFCNKKSFKYVYDLITVTEKKKFVLVK